MTAIASKAGRQEPQRELHALSSAESIQATKRQIGQSATAIRNGKLASDRTAIAALPAQARAAVERELLARAALVRGLLAPASLGRYPPAQQPAPEQGEPEEQCRETRPAGLRGDLQQLVVGVGEDDVQLIDEEHDAVAQQRRLRGDELGADRRRRRRR